MKVSYPPELPITYWKDDIIEAIGSNQVIIVVGDTGSGKTTQLPKMCLETDQGQNGIIGCTQPRRIAAVSVSERVGKELKNKNLVGYKIRFNDHTSTETKIKFMTDGVLLAETQSDNYLTKYNTLIIDEAHERNLNIDFLLGFLKQLIKKRPELKLIISSATIDTDKFSSYFDNAPLINVSGRNHPIAFEYKPAEYFDETLSTSYVDMAVQETIRLLNNTIDGDILIFMPTERDIRDCIKSLQGKLSFSTVVLPLFGRLQSADQRRIFKPVKQRKVIVATNIAETSITVPNISYVIDTGLARIASYNTKARSLSLKISKISIASCNQRAGRCGRTRPGTCIRLYSEEDYLSRSRFTRPEIQRSNLAQTLLQMVSLNLGEPKKFPFIDPPTNNALNDGFKILKELGALDKDNQLTRLGKVMSRLPLDPTISRMIIEGSELNAIKEIKIIASALTIMDPRIRPAERENEAEKIHEKFMDNRSDFLAYLNIWNSFFSSHNKISASILREFCKTNFLSFQRMREWFDIYEQISQNLGNKMKYRENDVPASYDAIHQALSSGLLRNICMKKQNNIYKTINDREAMLFPGSTLFNKGKHWLIAASLVETSQLFARTAAVIDVKWLERFGGENCRKSWSDPHWEKKSGQVIANEKVTLFGFPIVTGRKVSYGRTSEKAALESHEIFIHSALIQGKLNGNYDFLRHNIKMINQFKKMEERLRRRGIVEDEQVIYEFYDNRLDKNVFDRFTFNRFLKRKKGDHFLWMNKDHICQSQPDTAELYRFPPTLSLKSLELSLHYRFQPGHEQDGVSVEIPLNIAASIDPKVFEWLVPGLLGEKILYLLKKLPKIVRKTLVPLPDCVDYILDSLQTYHGSLYHALERAINKRYEVTIRSTDWQIQNLPPHLKMGFLLKTGNGRLVYKGRSYKDILNEITGANLLANRNNQSIQLPVKEKITTWDFKDLTKEITHTDLNNTLKIFYPTLFIDKQNNCLTLRYIEDKNDSMCLNRKGMLFLYSIVFSKEIKLLKKECKTSLNECYASFLTMGLKITSRDMVETIMTKVLNEIFVIEDGDIHGKKQFETTIEKIKSCNFFQLGRVKLDLIFEIIRLRGKLCSSIAEAEKKAHINKMYNKKRFESYQNHLEEVLPSNFLQILQFTELFDIKRYLLALQLRIIRAEQNPEKDEKKSRKIQSYANRFIFLKKNIIESKQCIKAAMEYRQMVKEYSVSIFAPELGTSIIVSEKRLNKKWQEVEDKCRVLE